MGQAQTTMGKLAGDLRMELSPRTKFIEQTAAELNVNKKFVSDTLEYATREAFTALHITITAGTHEFWWADEDARHAFWLVHSEPWMRKQCWLAAKVAMEEEVNERQRRKLLSEEHEAYNMHREQWPATDITDSQIKNAMKWYDACARTALDEAKEAITHRLSLLLTN